MTRVCNARVLTAFFVSATAVMLYACGGGSSSSMDLSDNAKVGRELARNNGCASCHGSDFGGGAGPTWKGLAGSSRPLTDDSVVTADRAYLVEAIMDPEAKIVRGYALVMPRNNLSAEQVERIVDYIEALG